LFWSVEEIPQVKKKMEPLGPDVVVVVAVYIIQDIEVSASGHPIAP
jgi:hypothetical protein